MKNFSIKPFPSLSAAVHQMVMRAPNGVSARTVADISGYNSYQTMMSELSRQQGHKLGADMLLPLMDACDSNTPLVFLARERGGVFIPLPTPASNRGELIEKLALSIKEFGDFASESAVDFADGKIPKDQLDRIIKEGQETVEAIMSVIRLARETHEKQYGGK